MSKSTPFAREDVMQAYLDSLLQSPEDPAEVTANTARLLEQATADIIAKEPVVAPVAEPVIAPPVTEEVTDTAVEQLNAGCTAYHFRWHSPD